MTTEAELVQYRVLRTSCDATGCRAQVSRQAAIPSKLKKVRAEWHDHLRACGWTIDIIEHRCPQHRRGPRFTFTADLRATE